MPHETPTDSSDFTATADDSAAALVSAAADLVRLVEELSDRETRFDALERELEATRGLLLDRERDSEETLVLLAERKQEIAAHAERVSQLEHDVAAARAAAAPLARGPDTAPVDEARGDAQQRPASAARELRTRRTDEERQRRRLDELERELRLARDEARAHAHHVRAIHGTLSWRLTRPLRAIRRVASTPSQTSATGSADDSAASGEPRAVANAAVLFVSGAPEVARRYRCDHQAEQLELLGATTEIGVWGEVDLLAEVERHASFVFHRVPWGDDVELFLARARELDKPVVFDTDDLTFDPEVMPYVAALDDLPEEEVRLYEEGLYRYRRTLRECDAVIVSTEPLARLASELHNRVVVSPNVASSTMLDAAELALAARMPLDREAVTIGYLAGTNTHNKDFLAAADAVVDILEAFPSARFLVVGPLRLDERFEAFGARVERLPFLPWQQLANVQMEVDVNLAPLEPDNPFTESKSCVKWIEAGVTETPTVASPRPDFRRVVVEGETGFLAEGREEWRGAIERLVGDARLRHDVGRAARRTIVDAHTTIAQAPAFYRAVSELARRRPGPLTMNWLMRAPIAQNSGGYRNIFRIATILGERGHTQRMYVEPIAHLGGLSDARIRRFVDDAFGVPSNGEVVVGHDDLRPADISIATHWPTASTVAAHDASLFKGYFIQDFEPDFYEETDSLYAEAERTYMLPLRHICLGRHLANRLHEFTGVPSETVDFALDPHFTLTRSPEERGDRIRVIFFARPSLRRRGYDVGVTALAALKQQRPDVSIVFFGSPTDELGEVPFEFTNLGVIDAASVARAMNESHILLTFSLTNISNVPYEGMACGCAVVDLDLPNVSTMVDPGRNCLLAPFEPQALADAMTRLTDDPDLRLRIAHQGAADASVRTWARTASMFEEALYNTCFVHDPSFAGR